MQVAAIEAAALSQSQSRPRCIHAGVTLRSGRLSAGEDASAFAHPGIGAALLLGGGGGVATPAVAVFCARMSAFFEFLAVDRLAGV